MNFTDSKYEEIRKESEDKQVELKEKIAQLDQAEREYYMTVSFLVELGSRSSDIFSRSKPHEKRALLNFVLSNRELDSEKVLYKAKFPFNMVLKYAPSSNWLPLWDSTRTKEWVRGFFFNNSNKTIHFLH